MKKEGKKGVPLLLDTGLFTINAKLKAGDEFQYHTQHKTMLGYRKKGKPLETGRFGIPVEGTHSVYWEKPFESMKEFKDLMKEWAEISGLSFEIKRMKKKGPWKRVLRCEFFKKEARNGKRKK